MDPFDDFFPAAAAKSERAGGKFQPKSKFQPRKAASASVHSSQPSQTVDMSKDDHGTNKMDTQSKTNGYSISGVHSSDERRSPLLMQSSIEHVSGENNSIVGRHSDNIMPDGVEEWHSCVVKSAGENTDIFLGLESLVDFLSQHGTFPGADGESSLPPSQPPIFHVSDMSSTEKEPSLSHVDGTYTVHAHMSPELMAPEDPLTSGVPAVSNCNGTIHADEKGSNTKESGAFSFQESVDAFSGLTAINGRPAGKFQPKPKRQSQKEKHSVTFPHPDAVKSVSFSQDAELAFCESENMDEGSMPACPPDHVLHFSAVGFNDSVSTHGPVNPVENSPSDAAVLGEDTDHEMLAPQRAKGRKRKTVLDSAKHQKTSVSGQEDGTSRSLRPRRNRTTSSVHEFDDDVSDSKELPDDFPDASFSNEDNSNDGEYQMESESRNKRKEIKSKKPFAGKEKAVRERKKADEVSHESTKRRSKFLHSTRRKTRRVDKVLLETPEDEIDFQKVPIRDLILLAEHKEKIMNKEATTSGTPLVNQSLGNSSAHYGEDEALASDHGGFSNNEDESCTVKESSTYFNYQTYMDKTPRARWSKEDTELFYKAVRQFGTDLSMIKQLFPGRTRQQIKSKYKKEERVHPLRLNEALASRAIDHSHFELVIQQLQQIAAEEKLDNSEVSIGLSGEEEATTLSPETNEQEQELEEVAKSEEKEEAGADGVDSPLKSDDNEDDIFRWSQYKSEL